MLSSQMLHSNISKLSSIADPCPLAPGPPGQAAPRPSARSVRRSLRRAAWPNPGWPRWMGPPPSWHRYQMMMMIKRLMLSLMMMIIMIILIQSHNNNESLTGQIRKKSRTDLQSLGMCQLLLSLNITALCCDSLWPGEGGYYCLSWVCILSKKKLLSFTIENLSRMSISTEGHP